MLGETIPRLLHLAVAATPDRVLATLEDEAVTYRQCHERAARLANALAAWGVGKGDRVLYWADLSLRAIDLFFAISQLGAVFVPANPAFSLVEMEAVADYLEPQAVIADPARQEPAAQAAARVGAKFAVLGSRGGTVANFDLEAAAERASDRMPQTGPSGADPNVMFLTSGSTGRPKAVVLSHRAHWLRSASSPHYDCVSGGRGTGCMFPLFHMAGWLMILQAMGRRRTIHMTRQASADQLWAVIERHNPQELYGIPAIWRRLLEGKGGDGRGLALALTGTSRVEPDLVEAMRARFPNARNGIFYGSTEMGVSLGAGHDDIDLHPYSVGLPMPGVEARIEDGELLLRSDTAMDGYFRLPQETAEAMQDGWYHSGDLVSVDADGYFEIVGRRKEMIRSGGEWIAPAEVEAAVAEIPGVREAAVVGLPHESWGELVCAVLVTEPGGPVLDLAAVRAHLDGRLAPFKHPRRVECRVTALPRTPATGQVQRSRVRQELIAAAAPVQPA
jgi:acyl-CoA synthetase (AMP-forming)/AMP-acid ligase II